MWLDLRQTIRSFSSRPAFPLVSIAMLALAVGGNVAIFSLLNATVLRPLPVSDQERLFVVWESDPVRERPHIEVSFPSFEAWRSRAEAFDEMAVFLSASRRMALLNDAQPYAASVSIVATSFFDTLGVSAAIGRTFLPEDGAPGTSNVVVIEHSFWSRFFGGDPSIVGRDVVLDGDVNTNGAERFTVVGVTEPGFVFPHGAEIWFPAQHSLENVYRKLPWAARQKDFFGVFWVVGKLRDGATAAQARAELNLIVEQLAEDTERPRESLQVVLTPFLDHFLGASTRTALLVIQVASVLFLFVACANVSALFLVRGIARSNEMALRLSLGASRLAALRRLFFESGLIVVLSACLGVVLGTWTLRVVLASVTRLPRSDEISVDATVTVFTIGVALSLSALVTLPSAWYASRLSMRRGGEHQSAARSTRRVPLDRVLLSVQTAIACTLFVGAFLVTQSYVNLRNIDVGYLPSQASTFKVYPIESKYPSVDARHRLYRELLERLEALPNVDAVGIGYLRPFEFGPVGMDANILLEGQTGEDAPNNPNLNWMAATPDYFRAMGLPFLEGRTFDWSDDMQHPPVVIVGASLAERLWPGESALGKKVLTAGARRDEETDEILWQSVIGVVEDGRYRELESPRYDLYVPMLQADVEASNVVIRSELEPLQLLAQVRVVMAGLDPDVPIAGFAPLTEIVGTAYEQRRLTATLFDVFAAMALLFAATGVFGVTSYAVATRTKELGLRMALGARPRDTVALVLKRGLGAVAVGVTAGLAVAATASSVVESYFFGLDPMDWGLYVAGAGGVLVTASLACFFPARRAGRVDPLVALRHE